MRTSTCRFCQDWRGAGEYLDFWIDAADVATQHRLEERAAQKLGGGHAEGMVFFGARYWYAGVGHVVGSMARC